jgi:hypothetical protein
VNDQLVPTTATVLGLPDIIGAEFVLVPGGTAGPLLDGTEAFGSIGSPSSKQPLRSNDDIQTRTGYANFPKTFVITNPLLIWRKAVSREAAHWLLVLRGLWGQEMPESWLDVLIVPGVSLAAPPS